MPTIKGPFRDDMRGDDEQDIKVTISQHALHDLIEENETLYCELSHARRKRGGFSLVSLLLVACVYFLIGMVIGHAHKNRG
jgi:hypothetical protein